MSMHVDWWNEAGVIERAQRALRRGILRLAGRIEERAKVNITDADLIDTGFMRASVYVAALDRRYNVGVRSGYGQVEADAMSLTKSSRSGREVDHKNDMDDEVTIGDLQAQDAVAAVVVGANYTIYHEVEHHFLHQAVADAQADIEGELQTSFREEGF